MIVTQRVAITAPPATTAISQMGSLVFLPTSWASFFPLSTTEGSGVVLGFVGTVATSVITAVATCVVLGTVVCIIN